LKKEKQVITVVLAISSDKVREGIQLLLEMEPDISIIGKADNGITAVNIVRMLQPNVLIMELMIGKVKDVKLIEQTGKLSPVTSVVVFSLYNAMAYVKEVLQAGAKGYVLKESLSNELIDAIRHVVAGNRYLSPSLSDADNER
jgi:two-component system response regulator NreC